jgi:hypothetical protein
MERYRVVWLTQLLSIQQIGLILNDPFSLLTVTGCGRKVTLLVFETGRSNLKEMSDEEYMHHKNEKQGELSTNEGLYVIIHFTKKEKIATRKTLL